MARKTAPELRRKMAKNLQFHNAENKREYPANARQRFKPIKQIAPTRVYLRAR